MDFKQAVLFREFCRLKAGLKPAVLTNNPDFADDVVRGLRIKGIQKLKVVLESKDQRIKVSAWLYAPKSLMAFVYRRLVTGKNFDDYLLGLLMGFPRCCIKAYIEDGGIVNAYERYKKQCGGLNPYKIEIHNQRGYYVQTGVISHIPCSPFCGETKELASKFTRLCEICESSGCAYSHIRN